MSTHPQPPQPSPWDAVEASGTSFGSGRFYLARLVDTARQQVEAQHAEEVKALTAKAKDAEEWADLVARGQSPCGHWKAYCYTEDGIGRQVDCWQCRAERAESQLATLQATVTAREQEIAEMEDDRDSTNEALATALKLNVAYRKEIARLKGSVCPHCELPAVMPEVCTPEINAVIERNIARDWGTFNNGFDSGKLAGELDSQAELAQVRSRLTAVEQGIEAICPHCKEPVSDSPLEDLPQHGTMESECGGCGQAVEVTARRRIYYSVRALTTTSPQTPEDRT